MAFALPPNGVNPMIGTQPFNVFNKIPMAPPLYVGDLDENIHDETLHDFFSKFGPIHFVRIMRDPATGKSRGFGFVNFIYPRDADSARQYAQYEKLGRKYIRIMFKRNIRDLPSDANIFIKNLSPAVTVKDLHNHFSQVGPIICTRVATNSEGQNLGYGYVQFEKKEDAETCLKVLQNSRLRESELQLSAFVSKDRRATTNAKRNVYVKNFPLNKTEAEISKLVAEIFSQYGEVETQLIKKHPTENKFSAFVCFKDEEAAQKAFSGINDNPKTLEGAEGPLYANWHQGRAERLRELKRHHSVASNETNLFVKNLKPEVTEADLKKAFTHFGKVTSVAVKDWTQGEGQKKARSGFIAFENTDDAKRAQLEASTIPEIRALYLEGADVFITFHQSRERRNEYLYTQRRRRMQTGMMNMDVFKGMPFPFANRRFQQPYPPMMVMNNFRGPFRGGRGHGRGGNQPRPHNPRNAPHRGQREVHYNKRTEKGERHTQQQVATPTQADTSNLTVHNLRTKLSEFLQLDIEKQRQILGELLFPLIKDIAGEQIAPKITGMLIDLSVLEVSEILEFLENHQLLVERIEEAKTLILEENL